MIFHFKDIHIGKMIEQLVREREIDLLRIANFLNVEEDKIEAMYKLKSMDTALLLQWSKLLEYDFFRIYSQHILLYAPFGQAKPEEQPKKSALPQFRKKLYTPEIIEFIIELVEKKEKTKQEIINEYRIPKTTLYKWLSKHKKTKG